MLRFSQLVLKVPKISALISEKVKKIEAQAKEWFSYKKKLAFTWTQLWDKREYFFLFASGVC